MKSSVAEGAFLRAGRAVFQVFEELFFQVALSLTNNDALARLLMVLHRRNNSLSASGGYEQGNASLESDPLLIHRRRKFATTGSRSMWMLVLLSGRSLG